jgi:uroporphyrinogen-III decarboxylase
MNAEQWETLLAVIRGETIRPVPTGFIIDSPWLPNWCGHTLLDYYTQERVFLEDNLTAIDAFPSAMLLPGFWSEFGMCTEPSAFGALLMWGEDEFPFAGSVLRSPADVERLEKPDPRRHGLLPFVVKRLQHLQPAIRAAGHEIRFAVARGPFNVASFLMGTTEFLSALKLEPAVARRLLAVVTDFLVDWIRWQRECFPSIDGLLVLDDIIGFVGPADFEAFGLPCLARVFDTDVAVKFFHNDAPSKASAPYLAGIGINLLNFGVQHTLNDMRRWTGGSITLVGNIPPRDVLAAGTPADVARAVSDLLATTEEKDRLVVSCGGGMPPGAPTENVNALISTVEALTGPAGRGSSSAAGAAP